MAETGLSFPAVVLRAFRWWPSYPFWSSHNRLRSMIPKFGLTRSINWFPGHMAKATKVMKSQLKACDMVVEIRDARIPVTSANPYLTQMIGNKPRLIVYNKADLSDPQVNRALKRGREVSADGRQTVMFTSLTEGMTGAQDIFNWASQYAKQRFKTTGALIMVAGIPNVGKSTLINALRRTAKLGTSIQDKQVAKVGARPGVTQHVSSIKVSERPLLYLMDTPGVMLPRVSDSDAGLKLALSGAIKDEVVGEELLAEFLLHCLVHAPPPQKRRYMKELRLKSPPTDLEDLFAAIYRRSGGYGKPDSVSRTMACAYLLKLFRDGRLGQWTLDDATDLILQHEPKERRIQSGVGVGQGIAGLELAPVMNLDEHGDGPSFWDGLGSRRKSGQGEGQ